MANKNMMIIVALVVVALIGIGGYVLWSGNQQQSALDAKRQDEMKAEAEKVKADQEKAMAEQKKAMDEAKAEMEKASLEEIKNLAGSTSPDVMMKAGTNPNSKTSDKMMAKEIPVTLAVVDKTINQTGTAKVWEENGKVKVSVSVTPVSKDAQPAHIHTGTCPGVGAVVYPLKDVVNGKSETELSVTMAELTKKAPLVINVHKSAAESKVYTACGAVKL